MREALRSRKRLGNPAKENETVVQEKGDDIALEVLDLNVEGLQHEGEVPGLTREKNGAVQVVKEECGWDGKLSTGMNVDLDENRKKRRGLGIRDGNEDVSGKMQIGARVLRSMSRRGDDKKFDNGDINVDFVAKTGESGGIEKEKVKEEKVEADQFVCNGYEKEKAKVKVKGKLKRKRGRPPKVKMEEQDRLVVESPRKRGRPPKLKMEEQDRLVGELPWKFRRRPNAGRKHNFLKVAYKIKRKVCFGKGKKGLSTIDGVNPDTSDDKCSNSRSCREELKKRSSSVKKRDTGENLEIDNNKLVRSTSMNTSVAQKQGKSTAKQLVRDQIWGLLKDAGWTVDFRPRNGKDYNDAVYVSLDGKTHWSITLAYNRLKMHCEAGDGEGKAYRPGFKFSPIPEEDFNILTKVMSKNRQSEKKLKQKGKKDVLDKKVKKEKQGYSEGQGQSMKGKKKRRRSLLEDSPSVTSSNRMPLVVKNHKRQKTQNKKRRGLLVRNAEMEMDSETDGYVPYNGKRTILAWMIDLGTVLQNGKVQYMNHRRKCPLLEGRITAEGIHCNCCNEMVTISKFEAHARSKLSDPLKNIYLEGGTSLFQCLLDSWNKQDESERNGLYIVDVTGEDPNDDTCGLCGDGGDLICCDGCPSTFHQSCLDIKKFPSGDWRCIYCCCKFCGSADESTKQRDSCDAITSCTLLSCHLCEEKYHRSCIETNDAMTVDWGDDFFCGDRCKELSERFEMLLGVKQEIGDGFSCTFIRRSDVGTDVSQIKPQMVECNSKLAVALLIMNECFMPYIDHRSGINLIHSIVYNCWSNFNRLNFGGFFTAILERGDEIISAASIRIHGNQLAEMPFIGTRSMYRRQGMCRRLLNGIELALYSLNVELLVIPAISELRETWTSVFGFEPLEATIKQKIKKMNLMVFPHVDMLQKKISEHQYAAEKLMPREVTNPQFLKHQITQEVANNFDEGGPSGLDSTIPADILVSNACQMNDNLSSIECDSQILPGLSNNTPDIMSQTMHGDKGSRDLKFQELSGAAYDNFEVEDKANVNTHDDVTVANYQDDQIVVCQNSGSGCINLAPGDGRYVGASSEGVENFYGGTEVADQFVTNNKISVQNCLHHLVDNSKLESQVVFCTKESKDSANIICHDLKSTFPSTEDSGTVHHASLKLLVAECAPNTCKKIHGSCQLRNHDSVQPYSVGSEVQFEPINGCDSQSRRHSDFLSGEVVCPTNILMHLKAPKNSANVPVNCKESSSAVSELNAEEAIDCDAESPSLQTQVSSGDCTSLQVASADKNLASNDLGMNPSSKQLEPDLQVDQTLRNTAPSSCSPNTASGMALLCASAGATSCGNTEVIVLSHQAG